MSGKKAQSLFYIAKKTKALGHKKQRAFVFSAVNRKYKSFLERWQF